MNCPDCGDTVATYRACGRGGAVVTGAMCINPNCERSRRPA